jgi:hypothetical protein
MNLTGEQWNLLEPLISQIHLNEKTQRQTLARSSRCAEQHIMKTVHWSGMTPLSVPGAMRV